MLSKTALDRQNDDQSAGEAISAAAPFTGLPQAVIDQIASAASIRRYDSGETIFAAGQFDGSEFLIVSSGTVRIARADPSGAMIFENAHGGATYGLPAAVLGAEAEEPGSETLAAESECEIVAVDAESFRQIIQNRPSLTRNLMLHFAARLTGENRGAASETAPERRVYAALTALIERDAVSGDWRIARMPKHRELADKAGVDEADAANAVAMLIQSGVARRQYPGLVIDDIAQLNRLAR